MDSRDVFEYRYSRGVSIPHGRYRYPKAGYRYPRATFQRSPTAKITFGTIKQASKLQEKANASLYNIIMIKNCLSA
ncbi:hypothetical protein GQ457_11G032630 [Hibiscus cannabinus]